MCEMLEDREDFIRINSDIICKRCDGVIKNI